MRRISFVSQSSVLTAPIKKNIYYLKSVFCQVLINIYFKVAT